MDNSLGHITVIANPAAQSGQARVYTDRLQAYLREDPQLANNFNFLRTKISGDGERIAYAARNAQTILALGGDGIIHEIVNGIMRLPEGRRPTLGIIPVGTGNDYARTLGLSIQSPKEALNQFFSGTKRKVDLGRVNERYFVESLSFGLDAAIALDTSRRRLENPNKRSRGLFVTSGIKYMSHVARGWNVQAQFDGEELSFSETICALQLGPSYGGGFKICPNANPIDGQLHCCYNTRLPNVAHALLLFAKARFGKHTKSSILEFRQSKHVVLDFEEEPPAQADGEALEGTHFEIDVIPQALDVIVGNVKW
ncbi:MAG: diacylglycerol kinase family lipid kinase [Atopobiaceae bacterium]|nr:diacylglycerol kinase family lipid kinase [Atopobiaceae bacterium]